MISSKIENRLIEKARTTITKSKMTGSSMFGDVGAALLTKKGNIHYGVNLALDCGIGFCAEHSAVASMISDGESRIIAIVAISSDGKVIPPCGRCRELIYQVNDKNLSTQVIVRKGKKVSLKKLLPDNWQKEYYKK